MRFLMKGFLLLALVAGVVAIGLMGTAQADNWSDTYAKFSGNATDLDSTIINGRPANLDVNTSDSRPGFLYVGYFKTNGTKTNAQAQGTQDTTYSSDTVLGVPTGELFIRSIDDSDSDMRQSYWEAFVRIPAVAGAGAETYPRKIPPESGDTFAEADSVPWVILETGETGIVMLSITNTSNYACTFTVLIHAPDTDYRVASSGAGQYIEAPDARIEGKYYISLAGDSRESVGAVAVLNGGYIRSNDHTPHVDTVSVIPGGNLLAEDAETFVFLRIATDTGSAPRDTLRITVVLYPDTGPNYSKRFARVFHDSGYVGDNDTIYGQGGSEDSVSVFILTASALVRAQKKDTVYSPKSYMYAVGDTTVARWHDTVPGSLILYTITYDNDGNRRADSISIVDFLDSNVDLYVGPIDVKVIPSVGVGDTVYTLNGVDTRMSHGRYVQTGGGGGPTNNDTGIVVEFATRANMASFFVETNLASFNQRDSVCDTVGAIRIRWDNAYKDLFSLRRDQFDDGILSGGAIDPLQTIDTLIVNTLVSSDSGDAGRIRFAVVIR